MMRIQRFGALLWMALALASCQTLTAPIACEGTAEPALLSQEIWLLVQVVDPEGRVTSRTGRLTLRFDGAGYLGGRAGPNSYGGRYEAQPNGSIRIEEILSTLIGGAEAEETARYLGWMQQATRFEVSPSALRLQLPGDGFLHFRSEAIP